MKNEKESNIPSYLRSQSLRLSIRSPLLRNNSNFVSLIQQNPSSNQSRHSSSNNQDTGRVRSRNTKRSRKWSQVSPESEACGSMLVLCEARRMIMLYEWRGSHVCSLLKRRCIGLMQREVMVLKSVRKFGWFRWVCGVRFCVLMDVVLLLARDGKIGVLYTPRCGARNLFTNFFLIHLYCYLLAQSIWKYFLFTADRLRLIHFAGFCSHTCLIKYSQLLKWMERPQEDISWEKI